VQVSGVIGVRGRCNPTLIGADGTNQQRQSTFEEQALRIAKKNEIVREAFRTHISVKPTWPALYRVFETIKQANNGKIPTAWATEREIDDFKQTANNPDDDPTSRHGFIPGKAVYPRMTIAQGHVLIQKIFIPWVNALISASHSGS
jgi:hypothetical protein